MNAKQIFKQKPSVYVFGVSVALCLAMFVYALVSLCMYSAGNQSAKFLNIIQMIFSVACVLILAIYFAYVKFSKLEIKEPLNIYFIAFIVVFFGVYPCFDLYANTAAMGTFFTFLGFTLAVISISVFFHFSKKQNGTVHANPWFLVFFQIGFTTLFVTVVETLVYLISKSAETNLISTVESFVSQLGYAWIGMIVVSIISTISIVKSKYFVNMCLIKQISD